MTLKLIKPASDDSKCTCGATAKDFVVNPMGDRVCVPCGKFYPRILKKNNQGESKCKPKL